MHIVRSGPRLDRVRSLPADHAWNNGRKYLVGYVGVIGPQEGLDLLMESVKHIVQRGRADVQFVVAGGGPALDDVRRFGK